MAAGSQRLDAVRRLTKPRRRHSLATESPVGWTSCRTPGYRRHSGKVRASPVPGYRPVRRTHRKALCRQPKRPERSSIMAPTTGVGDGAKSDPFVDRASEGILGVTAMRATPGPRLLRGGARPPAINERELG